jgi:hypothetical protein
MSSDSQSAQTPQQKFRSSFLAVCTAQNAQSDLVHADQPEVHAHNVPCMPLGQGVSMHGQDMPIIVIKSPN